MKTAALMLLIMTAGPRLAQAQAPTWCFGLPCLQSPRLDFTAGKNYERAPEFRGEPVAMPPYKRVKPLERSPSRGSFLLLVRRP